MSNKNTQSAKNTPAAEPTLEELKAAAEEARQKASEAAVKAGQPDATAEDKDAVKPLEEAAQAAEKARDDAQAAADAAAAAEAQRKATEQSAAAQDALDKPKETATVEVAAAAPADPEDDPQYVPILRDEDGERIPRNSLIRLVTTTGLNLRSLDGELITPDPQMELKGPDVRRGDWYTVQFAAGLIAVDSVKKLK